MLVFGAVGGRLNTEDRRQSAEYSRQNTGYRAELLDASGRKVRGRQASSIMRKASGVTRIVVTK